MKILKTLAVMFILLELSFLVTKDFKAGDRVEIVGATSTPYHLGLNTDGIFCGPAIVEKRYPLGLFKVKSVDFDFSQIVRNKDIAGDRGWDDIEWESEEHGMINLFIKLLLKSRYKGAR